MTDMTPTSPTPKPKPRPRPQVMKLTEAAATRVAELTKRADSEIVGLRVGRVKKRRLRRPVLHGRICP